MNAHTHNACRTRSNRVRSRFLGAAIVAALAAGAAGTVSAQSYGMISIVRSPWGQTLNLYNYIQGINDGQLLNANVNGTLLGSSVSFGGNGNGFPSSVTNNFIFANATGNDAPTTMVGSTLLPGNSIELGLLGVDAGPPLKSGLGIIYGQTDRGGTITASLTTVATETNLTNHRTGDVTQAGNLTQANATGNNASNGIAGTLPAGFSGNTPGITVVQFGIPSPDPNAGSITSYGDLALTSSQSNLGGGVNASVDTAAIAIHDTSTGTVSAAFVNSGTSANPQQISANAHGNISDNGIRADGGAPVYNGSATLTNAQGNLLTSATAQVSDSNISTLVDGTSTFTGTLDQSFDHISAAVQGNQTSNTLAFAHGINIQGDSAPLGLGLTVANNGGTLNAAALADLALLNVQSNVATFTSQVSGSSITATVNALSGTGSTATLGNDQIEASSGGNAAVNNLSTSGAAFAATASAGSQQANYSTHISATVGDATIALNSVGTAASRGQASVSDNTISASAQGNQASTGVDLAATNFQTGHGDLGIPASVTSSTTTGTVSDGGVQTGAAGINAANMQGNYKATFFAVQPITASVTHPQLGAFYAGSISAGAVVVGTNVVSAAAGGNLAETSVFLHGTNASALTAALGNDQFNNSAVGASVSDGLLGITVDNGSVAAASLDVSTNEFAAQANGNQATNALSTDFSNTVLGSLANPWTHASNRIDTTAGTNSGYAALTLLSNQANYSDITANLSNDQIAVSLGLGGGGNLTNGAALTLDNNRVVAAALANSVGNTLSPGVGTLTTNSGSAAQIAALGNLQQDFGSVVSASIQPTTDFNIGQIYAQIQGNVTAADVSLSSNLVSALAGGNDATNALALGGDVFTPAAPAAGAFNAGQTSYSGGVALATADFTVQNVQSSAGGSRIADINHASIKTYLGNAAATARDSSFTYNANAIKARAYDNHADNSLGLGTMAVPWSVLDTTAALQNVQTSSALVSSTLRNTAIGFHGVGDVRDSTLTVSGNLMTALAQGNVASNGVDIHAGQLAGNSLDLAALPVGLRGALLSDSLVLADYGLSNYQIRPDGAGTVGASLSLVNPAVAVGGSIRGGAVSLTDNVLAATAQVNQAINALGIQADNSLASAAVLNSQTVGVGDAANALVTNAIVNLNLFGSGGLTGTNASTLLPVTLSGNQINAVAGLNAASNSLDVGASGSIGSAGVTASGATTDITVFAGHTGAVADFALASSQQASSSVTASISTASAIKIESGGAVTNSALTLVGNALNALASANGVGNVLNLGNAASISASAAVANVQNATGGIITAGIDDSLLGVVTPNGDNIRNSQATVSNNRLLASASGNSALNALSVLPTALNIGNLQPTLASVSGSAYTATASYSLLNAQSNADAISSTISNSSIGVNPAPIGTVSPLLTSIASVGGNNAVAQALGNNASNAISLAALSTGVGSSALVSNQINTANITATITNVHIGVTAGINSSSPVTVSGNTISAVAIGNSVTNRIGFGISP